MHFMDDSFMNLGEEVKYVVFAFECSNAEFCESCVCVWERERERERERDGHITAECTASQKSS